MRIIIAMQYVPINTKRRNSKNVVDWTSYSKMLFKEELLFLNITIEFPECCYTSSVESIVLLK